MRSLAMSAQKCIGFVCCALNFELMSRKFNVCAKWPIFVERSTYVQSLSCSQSMSHEANIILGFLNMFYQGAVATHTVGINKMFPYRNRTTRVVRC